MNRILKNLVYHAPWLFSDRRYLELKWQLRTGKALDLDNPLTFNEKIQWIKLYDRRVDYTMMSDKSAVKQYISDIIGQKHIIPTIALYDKVSEIEWDKLPQQFVLKCTHDSGGIAICRDRNTFDRKKAESILRRGLRERYYLTSREWGYKGIKPRIICEKFMCDPAQSKGLVDYKFFCFNGAPQFLYISEGLENHSTASISFADMNGKALPFGRSDFKSFEGPIPLPQDFGQMKKIAAKIANTVNNRFVRVDLYEINGCVYFSELTFYPNGGYTPFQPQEWDRKIGEMLKL